MYKDQLCILPMPIQLRYSKVWHWSDPYPKIVEISRMNKMSVDLKYFRRVRHRAIHYTLQRCFKTKYMCSNYHNHNHHHYHWQCIQLSLSASSTRHTLSQTSIAGVTLFSSPVTVESLVLLASCCLSSVMDRQNISAHSTTDQTLWSRIWDWPSPSALPTNQC